MLEFLTNYNGKIFIDDKEVLPEEINNYIISDNLSNIRLIPKALVINNNIEDSNNTKKYRITVQDWMLKISTDDFKFMSIFNEDKPMPLKVMDCVVVKETNNMYYIQATAPKKDFVICARCGRLLTTPLSKLVGIGPECLRKLGLIDITISDTTKIRNKLNTIIWTGWVLKSAIITMEEL